MEKTENKSYAFAPGRNHIEAIKIWIGKSTSAGVWALVLDRPKTNFIQRPKRVQPFNFIDFFLTTLKNSESSLVYSCG